MTVLPTQTWHVHDAAIDPRHDSTHPVIKAQLTQEPPAMASSGKSKSDKRRMTHTVTYRLEPNVYARTTVLSAIG